MDSGIPLLNPDQIEELNNMLYGILDENKKKLDDTLSESVEIEQTSVLNLYRLVVDQWHKKQKIIENLCHFSLNMMNTIFYLWQQKFQREERLNTAELVIENLQRELHQLGDENEGYKQKISEAETHIESISVEREKIEELFRSQSCCAFQGQVVGTDICGDSEKKFIECSEHESILQQQKSQLIKESSKILQEKQQVIYSLIKQKTEIQKKFQKLEQVYGLTKMQVQLAEMAIKDALKYKQLYQSELRSNRDDMSSQRSREKIRSGQLQCFSNLEGSFHIDRKNILTNQFSTCEDMVHFSSTPCFVLGSEDEPVLETSIQKEDEDVESPFRKKSNIDRGGNKCGNQRNQLVHIEEIDSGLSKRSSKCRLNKNKQEQSFGLESIDDYVIGEIVAKVEKQSESIMKDDSRITDTGSSKFKNGKKVLQKSYMHSSMTNLQKQEMWFKSSAIVKRSQPKQDKGTLSKFYNFISREIVTKRIKVK